MLRTAPSQHAFAGGTRSPTAPSGFSLIELLVVMVIVVVLAGLLVPALARTRTAAKTIRCAANMRQILMGIHAYGQDNDGLLVSYWIGNHYWFDNLSPYLDANTSADKLNAKSKNVFYSCPEWNWTGSAHYTDMGYGMCHDNNVGSPRPFWSNWSWVATGNIRDGTIGELTYPSSRIVLGESGGLYIQAFSSVWAYWTTFGYDQSKWQGSPPAAANPVRHAGRANYGFVDGHVQSLDPLTSPWGYTDPSKLP